MDDQELLELAAKANWGSELDDVSLRWCDKEGCILYIHADNQDRNGVDREFRWDPLEDDGDAFRSANHTGLTIGQTFDGAYVDLCTGEILQKMPRGGCQHEVKWSEFGGDKNAACRKAIVLCLAQIGTVMP